MLFKEVPVDKLIFNKIPKRDDTNKLKTIFKEEGVQSVEAF